LIGTFIQGRKQKLQFTINPKSHGEEGYNLIEAVIYEKGAPSLWLEHYALLASPR